MKKKVLFFMLLVTTYSVIAVLRTESNLPKSSILMANVEAFTQDETDGAYIQNSELQEIVTEEWVWELTWIGSELVPVLRLNTTKMKCCVASNSFNRCVKSYQDPLCVEKR